MSDLIPLLGDLCFARNGFHVQPGFVETFVKLHQSSAGAHEGWRLAQDHWERIVDRALRTNVVSPTATGSDAVMQAVTGVMTVLEPLADRGRCSLCRRPDLLPEIDRKGAS